MRILSLLLAVFFFPLSLFGQADPLAEPVVFLQSSSPQAGPTELYRYNSPLNRFEPLATLQSGEQLVPLSSVVAAVGNGVMSFLATSLSGQAQLDLMTVDPNGQLQRVSLPSTIRPEFLADLNNDANSLLAAETFCAGGVEELRFYELGVQQGYRRTLTTVSVPGCSTTRTFFRFLGFDARSNEVLIEAFKGMPDRIEFFAVDILTGARRTLYATPPCSSLCDLPGLYGAASSSGLVVGTLAGGGASPAPGLFFWSQLSGPLGLSDLRAPNPVGVLPEAGALHQHAFYYRVYSSQSGSAAPQISLEKVNLLNGSVQVATTSQFASLFYNQRSPVVALGLW
ncbi:hypothetical protein MRY87_11420 [bacterium]|nr:hypothetical protein [bacterium]